MRLSPIALLLAATSTAALAAAPANPVDSAAISGLGIRNIGSATMSGRIAAVAGHQNDDGKTTLFIGSASGGVWKSEDSGTTFRPVFDKAGSQSIGAIAIDPKDPKTIWVGTGESWTRNSVSIGDGVWKSTDGGDNWTRMGLARTERITRIVVDPSDSRIVYACAPGALWSDSPDRGLYRTTDGGATWSQILKGGNLSTGCSSITLDPSNPKHLIAGLWDFRRKAWTFRSGGDGPTAPSGSRMMESHDGGATWTMLDAATRSGLPKGPWGRVEVVFAPSNPKMIYAFIENVRSALYASSDGGRTWQERDRSQGMVWRPFYFSRLVVDPKDDQRLYKMGYSVIASEDGGKSFANAAGASHGDWHDVWINPNNSKELVGADDGGLWFSHDGANKWWKGYNLPISQFYHVSVDDKDPYQVYGGLQDNSSWVGDQEYPGGITNSRWENLYGGDGMWTFADPSDPNYAYAEAQGGTIGRVNRKTLEARSIQPLPNYKEKLRYNWNTPIALSPHDRNALYIGSQFLFRSPDHGATWDRISPDLTTNDPIRQKQEQSGGITVDNSAAETNATIYSISESPVAAGMIWVGTDDGNVQLTRDGGAHWANLTKNIRVPAGSWISWVEASRTDPAVAYAAVDRHTFGDFAPYVFRTADYGRSWQPIIGPATNGVTGYAWTVREDPKNPNILFVGTEKGLFASLDRGAKWSRFRPSGFPDVAVRDIAFQTRDDDMVLATHGRGIWIVDDISPLRTLNSATLASDLRLIPSRPVEQRIRGNGGWAEGDATYTGQNPPSGAVISYYQRARHVIGRLKVEVLDDKGQLVDELPASRRRGLNRISWSMQTKPPQVPPAASIAGASTQGQRVLPGHYSVRITKNGTVSTMPLDVVLDPRATYTVADRKTQYDAAERVKAMFARMSTLAARIAAAREGAEKIADDSSTPAATRALAEKVEARANALRKDVVATTEGGAITGEERLREHADTVYGAITSSESAPTPYQLARVEALERELGDVEREFAALQASDLKTLNGELQRGGKAPINVASVDFDPDEARGGPLTALASGLLGTRFLGNASALTLTGEDDR
ncbi:MAG: sialidase [Sphingomicrobium sp.]